MRIAGVIVGALLLVLLVEGYLSLARRARPLPPEIPRRPDVDDVIIELTPSFAAEPGPWSSEPGVRFEVRGLGRTLVADREPIAPFETRRYRLDVALPAGVNELWCAAFAGPDAAIADDLSTIDSSETSAEAEAPRRALRVRIGRHGRWWVDRTFWSIPSGSPSGAIRFEIPLPTGTESPHARRSSESPPIAGRRPRTGTPRGVTHSAMEVLA